MSEGKIDPMVAELIAACTITATQYSVHKMVEEIVKERVSQLTIELTTRLVPADAVVVSREQVARVVNDVLNQWLCFEPPPDEWHIEIDAIWERLAAANGPEKGVD